MHITTLKHIPRHPHLQVLVELGVLLTQGLQLGPGGNRKRERFKGKEAVEAVGARRSVCPETLAGNGRTFKVVVSGPVCVSNTGIGFRASHYPAHNPELVTALAS